MQRSVNLLLGLALSASVAACAGTNREAESPDAEQAASEQEAAEERARTMTLPAPPPTIPDSPVPDQRAKQAPMMGAPKPQEQAAVDPAADPQALAAQEEAKAEAEQNAREQAKWDKLGRDADRKNTDAYARDRLAKAIERVNAVQNQSARVQGPRRLKLTHDVSAFNAKRADVESRIDAISVAGSDDWRITKEALDDAINELDALSYRIEGDL